MPILFFHQLIDKTHAIDLNSLSSFFELFSGFNLVYSIVEAFRIILNDEVLDVNRALREARAKWIQASRKVRLWENPRIDDRHEDLLLLAYSALDRIVWLYKWDRISRNYPDGFKSAFLMSGAFSLSVILLNGFSSYFETDDGSLRRVLGVYTILVLSYNLFVFARSFKTTTIRVNIKPFSTILVLISCVAVSYFYIRCVRKNPGSETSNLLVLSLAVFTSASAFLLHFLRAFVHKTVSRYKAIGYMMELDDILGEIAIMRSGLKLPIARPHSFLGVLQRIYYCFFRG